MRKRVAILGGGAAGLAAAWELSASPSLRDRHQITVYQSGWRLGGKGASGRNADVGQRIEEHGLHLWFGFYENAFAMIRAVYEELDRPSGSPLATWREAFSPFDDVVLYSEDSDGWHHHTWHFPPNDGTPGDPADETLETLIERGLAWAFRGGMHGSRADRPGPHRDLEASARDLLDRHRETGETHASGLTRTIDAIRDLARELHDAEEAVESRLQDVALTLDLGWTMVRGIVADGLLAEGFAKINAEELCDWLRRHGIEQRTLDRCPLLLAFYQLCFAYEGGSRDQPCVAAGKAVQAFARLLLTYQGSVAWRMQAGMGDTVFAPLYEVLRRRGVSFRFFTTVTGLGATSDGRDIDRIDIVSQAHVVNGEYRPLVDVEDLPCWPSEPRWEQLVDGGALRSRGVDFEHEGNPLGLEAERLQLGEDFDQVVLAIPVGALAPICRELLSRSPRLGDALASSRTVATQALQLWLRVDAQTLGCARADGLVAGAYQAPLDTYADMSHLIPRERWNLDDDVRHIAYFCGTMPDDEAVGQAASTERARRDGLEHLRNNMAALWPGAVKDGEFDFDLLVDAQGRSGRARYEAQYWRANVQGTHRYVITPPGSVERRLRADEAGFENLAVAGDWTRNGICGGSVEAAVTSGRMAARALCGEPTQIPGLNGWLEAD